MSSAIPPKIQEAIIDFLRSDKTGNITLHIKDGRIQGCQVAETIRLDKQYVDKTIT